MGIWEIVTSLFGGGLTGLLGSVISNIFQYKSKKLDLELNKQKFDQEVSLKRIDSEIMAQEWAARTHMAETEAKGREAVEDAKAFAASFNEPESYSAKVAPTVGQGYILVLLDTLRALVRPSLTIYLCVLTTLLYVDAHRLIKGNDLSVDQATALTQHVVNTILYLTTTCVLWWFGTRQKAEAPQK